MSWLMRLVSLLMSCKIWSTHYHMCKLQAPMASHEFIATTFQLKLLYTFRLLISGTKGVQLQFQLVISSHLCFSNYIYLSPRIIHNLLQCLFCCYFSISLSFSFSSGTNMLCPPCCTSNGTVYEVWRPLRNLFGKCHFCREYTHSRAP
jgi:hypothetical protein